MHFGGIHFFAGLFFLILSWLVVAIWLAILLQIIPCTLFLWQKIRDKENATLLKERAKRIAYIALIVSLAFHLTIYVTNRIEWCGSDNANFAAKEYFVAGQPLAGLRLVLTTVINPDNPVMSPLNALQQLIYNQGTQLLPKNDGEIGTWTDSWLNYPYIRRMWVPYKTSKREPSYRMRKLLDRTWFAMEAMSTKPFADKQMAYEMYQLNFPRSAFYYIIKDGYYADRYIGSSFELLKEPDYIRRCRLLYEWSALLRNRWIKQDNYETIKKSHPKIEALRQVVELDRLEDLIRSSIYSGEFSCDNPYIPLYVETRREFVDEKAENHVLKQLRRTEKRQAEDLYAIGVEGVAPAFLKYLLKQYCGVEILGDRSFGYKNREADKREVISQIKRLFRNEIKILEEGRYE